MFCKNCGKQVEDNVAFCPSCGASTDEAANNQFSSTPSQHTVPKCNCCGHIEDWKVEGLFRPMDYIIGIIGLIFGIVPGVSYLIVVGLIRLNKDRRAKICKKCGAKNMFTYMY